MEKSLTTDQLSADQVLAHLKQVVTNAMVSAREVSKKYTSTLLICFRWEEDDINACADIEKVSQVFEATFGARVVNVVLEMKQFTAMDVLRLLKFLHTEEYLLQDSQLVVVYYSGHGSNDNGLFWHAKSGDMTCTLDFNHIKLAIVKEIYDVIMILDCCCAMSAVKGVETGVTHELLGACGANGTSSVNTFAPALCKVLEAAPENIGFTVTQIHALLLQNLRTSPVHTFLRGGQSIRLVPVAGSGPVHLKDVVVCLHLNEDVSPETVNRFLEFLSEEPELTRSGYIKLLDARKANSTIILMILPTYLASILSIAFDLKFLYLVE